MASNPNLEIIKFSLSLFIDIFAVPVLEVIDEDWIW